MILNKLAKYLANRYLKQGHFILALVCRCENNRVFLHHNVEMRPGYLGKFLEFHFHDEALGPEKILEVMKERWHRVKYSEFLEQELA